MSDDHAYCAETLKASAARHGVEVTVSTASPLVPGPYETGVFTCPHGTTFFIEPTGEQIAEWVRTGTP